MKIRADWRQRLETAVGDRERAPISKAAKLNPTYLRDVLERGQTPSLKNAEKLSGALGMPLTEWYLEETVPKVETLTTVNVREPLTDTDVNVLQLPRDVPAYTGAIAGELDLFEYNTEKLDPVRRPPRLVGVKDAYALYVLGTSMEPWCDHGALVYVHPHLPVRPGDHVVIQLKQETPGGPIPAYIKKLVRRTEKDVRLLQYNPRKELVIPAKKVWAIHRIMTTAELFG